MFRLRPEAITDIDDITDYIAKDNPRAAIRLADEIRASCRRLGEMPGIGSPRSEVLPGLRVLVVGRYLILYREVDTDADILRVVHGARD